jgi:hypothetical protein
LPQARKIGKPFHGDALYYSTIEWVEDVEIVVLHEKIWKIATTTKIL